MADTAKANMRSNRDDTWHWQLVITAPAIMHKPIILNLISLYGFKYMQLQRTISRFVQRLKF